MGLELQAIEFETRVGRGQGRVDDARDLRIQLENVLTELSRRRPRRLIREGPRQLAR